MQKTVTQAAEVEAARLPARLALMVLAILALGAAVAWYGWMNWADDWRQTEANQGKVLAAYVVPGLVDLLRQNKSEATANVAKDLKNKASLAYVEVMRVDANRPFATTLSLADLPERRTRRERSGNGAQEDEVAGVPVVNVHAEIRDSGTLLGTLHLGIDASKVYWSRSAMIGLTGLEAFFLLAIGFVILQPFVQHVQSVQGTAKTLAARLQAAENTLADEKMARSQLETEVKQAKNASLSASHAKTTFLADLSQQLRTPMRQIAQTAELAMGADPSARAREHLQHLRTSAGELMTLVNDLLDFAQLDVGQLQLESIDFRLSELLDKLLRAPAMRAQAKNIRLDLDVGDNVPETVVGDPTRLRQVLYHLIDNAIKFTSRGSVAVQVDLVNQGAGEIVLRFTVSDTGIGIPVWKKESLFDPVALEEARARGITGGLSLAMSGKVVERMGGKMEVDSQVGRGTTFWFNARFRAPEKASRIIEVPKPRDRAKLRVILPRSKASNHPVTPVAKE
jgi:signal transduction histidine kinase